MPEYADYNSPGYPSGYGSRPLHPERIGNVPLALDFVIDVGKESTESSARPPAPKFDVRRVYLKNTVRCLYRKGKRSTKKMTVTLHSGISGRPGQAEVIDRFLEFIEQFPDIWITTGKEFAQLWYRNYPHSL